MGLARFRHLCHRRREKKKALRCTLVGSPQQQQRRRRLIRDPPTRDLANWCRVGTWPLEERKKKRGEPTVYNFVKTVGHPEGREKKGKRRTTIPMKKRKMQKYVDCEKGGAPRTRRPPREKVGAIIGEASLGFRRK